MPRRLIQLLLALFVVGLATVLIGPVAATMLTPGWLESADLRDWASMIFFLSVAAALLLAAFRLAFARNRSPYRLLGAIDWWVVAALSLLGTVCAAIASHWTIALPGLLPIAISVLLARRRARQERVTIVDADVTDLPPRATFTSARPSGKS
jgi:hypothetical protein